MNFISSVKDKMADRLKYDGSYEQIIKLPTPAEAAGWATLPPRIPSGQIFP